MGASLSNPHFLAFADHYNDAQAAGRAPMTWRQFLDTRALGPGDDERELRSWDMDMHVEHMAAQRRQRANESCAHITAGGPHTIRTVGNVGSIEDYTQPWGLVADLRIFRDRALGRQELKAIRRGVEATLPAAPAASDLVAPYDLTPGREYNAPPMDDY